MDASATAMGILCYIPEGGHYVWWVPFSTATRYYIVSYDNPTGEIMINYLELCTYVAQLQIFDLLLEPLEHLWTKV